MGVKTFSVGSSISSKKYFEFDHLLIFGIGSGQKESLQSFMQGRRLRIGSEKKKRQRKGKMKTIKKSKEENETNIEEM